MKKICVVSGYRSDYTKLKSVLKAIKNHKELELQLVVIGAHLLGDHGLTIDAIKKDGFEPTLVLETTVEGSTPSAMSKSIGLGVLELTTAFKHLKPDVVLVVGDRFETFSAAVASTMSSIPLAHIQGGEVSGTIDETIRHAITKLAHIHFPSTDLSAKRIEHLGEDPQHIWNVGCPAHDIITNHIPRSVEDLGEYVLILQHPNVLQWKNAGYEMEATLHGVFASRKKCILIYPNPDPGSFAMIKSIRIFESQVKEYTKLYGPIQKYKNVEFGEYLDLLAGAKCLVGNSSSGIREAFVFRTPVVNVGERQQDRERAGLIIDVKPHSSQIMEAIQKSIDLSQTFDYTSNRFGNGTAGEQIANCLSNYNLTNIINKRLCI